MDGRKNAILSAIIREHISTNGGKVASKALVDKYDFNLSPATIRNEMTYLEEEGYIFQPHTSAGRIPTEKGWRYYVNNFVKDTKLSSRQRLILDKAVAGRGKGKESVIKEIARKLSELSKEAVFVGFSKDDFYYTGLSNIFKKPEFNRIELIYHITEVVEHLDEVMREFFSRSLENEKEIILIGSENPFGRACSSILSGYGQKGSKNGLFGILGPMRMDYDINIAMVKYARGLISNLNI